jgi:hypothetical protein
VKVGARKIGSSRGGEEVVEGRESDGIDSFQPFVPLVKRKIELALSATALTNTNKDKIRQ